MTRARDVANIDGILTTKGDIYAATAAATPARLGVGSNGDTLVADSSATTGLRYQGNYAAGKNAMLNSDFSVWQRGTSINLTNGVTVFTADRWRCVVNFTAGTASVSRQAFTPGAAPVAGYEGQYFFRLNTGTTASTVILDTKIENVQTYAGQTVTFSFWGKASGNFTLKDTFRQQFGSGGSADVDSTVVSYNLTTSWQRFTRTLTLPSLAGKTIGTGSSLQIYLEQGTGALGGFDIDLWGMQLEAGSVATAFQTATGTIQGELAACQRYYVRMGGSANASIGFGQATTTTNFRTYIGLPVTMRANPSVSYSGTIVLYANASVYSPSAVGSTFSGPNRSSVMQDFTTSGLTANTFGNVYTASDPADFIQFSSEL
jgi:hypothetical protein